MLPLKGAAHVGEALCPVLSWMSYCFVTHDLWNVRLAALAQTWDEGIYGHKLEAWVCPITFTSAYALYYSKGTASFTYLPAVLPFAPLPLMAIMC